MTRALLLLCLGTVFVACDDGATDTTDSTDSTDSTDATDDTDDGGADLEAGEATFDGTCAQCHGADGTGNTGPNLDERVPSLTVDQVRTVVLNGQGYMPAQDLTEEEATNVAAFVVDRHGD